jgi:hypothetical protein
MEDWAEIRRLYRSEKLSQAAIARQLGLSRNTVAKALGSDAPPRYERAPVTTSAWAGDDAGDGDCSAGRLDGWALVVRRERHQDPPGVRPG